MSSNLSPCATPVQALTIKPHSQSGGQPPAAPHFSGRLERIDVLRALAMLWMTVFHACFDLQYFGFIHQNFYQDIFWTVQRQCIVSLFLFTAGLSQAVAVEQGLDWSRFFQRWWRIVFCAMAVSLGSWMVFPQSWIYFGVLHGLACMLLIARAFSLRRVQALRTLALAALVWCGWLIVQDLGSLGYWPQVFNQTSLNWLGLNWRKPHTEDFVPLLPWLAPIFLGCAAGRWWADAEPGRGLAGWMSRPLAPVWRPLVWLGRQSLAYYMLHQPILWGLTALTAWLMGRNL